MLVCCTTKDPQFQAVWDIYQQQFLRRFLPKDSSDSPNVVVSSLLRCTARKTLVHAVFTSNHSQLLPTALHPLCKVIRLQSLGIQAASWISIFFTSIFILKNSAAWSERNHFKSHIMLLSSHAIIWEKYLTVLDCPLNKYTLTYLRCEAVSVTKYFRPEHIVVCIRPHISVYRYELLCLQVQIKLPFHCEFVCLVWKTACTVLAVLWIDLFHWNLTHLNHCFGKVHIQVSHSIVPWHISGTHCYQCPHCSHRMLRIDAAEVFMNEQLQKWFIVVRDKPLLLLSSILT